jgi:hypothetical protein
MNKTILDEFAMAALQGWVSTLKPDATVNCVAVAASLYDLAGAMMAEREKRTPQPLMHAVPEDPRFPDGAMKAEAFVFSASPYSDKYNQTVYQFTLSNKGKRMTCTDILRFAFNLPPTMRPAQTELVKVSKTLRELGYIKVRSGGKDYYQL